MIDRGIIKWQPFNSCFNANEIVEDININKNEIKEKRPILSEDQLNILDWQLKNAYILKSVINLKYYYDGEIKNLIGKITSFDYLNKKICLNKQIIYFKQILEIDEI